MDNAPHKCLNGVFYLGLCLVNIDEFILVRALLECAYFGVGVGWHVFLSKRLFKNPFLLGARGGEGRDGWGRREGETGETEMTEQNAWIKKSLCIPRLTSEIPWFLTAIKKHSFLRKAEVCSGLLDAGKSLWFSWTENLKIFLCSRNYRTINGAVFCQVPWHKRQNWFERFLDKSC